MFARNRFQLISKFFHLVDNNSSAPSGHSNYDPCGKFNFLVDYANKIFREQYTPHCQLCVDESLVGTHCHCMTKQYLPNKKQIFLLLKITCYIIISVNYNHFYYSPKKKLLRISFLTFSIYIRKLFSTQTVNI